MDDEGMVEVVAVEVGGDGRRIGRGGGMGEGDGDLRSYDSIGSGVLSVGVKKTVSVGDGAGDFRNVEAVGDTDYPSDRSSTNPLEIDEDSHFDHHLIWSPYLELLLLLQEALVVHYCLSSFDCSSSFGSVD